jgi:hypothetical protein
MLKFTKSDTFTVRVPVSLPTDDPAKRNDGHFTATFRYLDRAAINAMLDEVRDGDLNDDGVLDRVLVKVEGIAGDAGPLPADEQLTLVRGHLALSTAAVKAYFAEAGGAEAKNSARSSRR